MILKELIKQKLITPPKWLPNNLHYLVKMGSHAYGTNNKSSDYDFYGFCIPPKEFIFPHLTGHINGFGTKPPSFEVYNEISGIYDFSIFSIVKFFQLCMENNPNMLDSLFVPLDCIVFQTNVGVLVRENRRKFIHKGCWQKFNGYAYSQMKSLKNAKADSNRAKIIEKVGYDVKAATHLFRLLFECIQLLENGEMDLRKHSQFLKRVRNGEFSYDKIIEEFQLLEVVAQNSYIRTQLPDKPREGELLELLHTAINLHYRGVSKFNKEEHLIQNIVSLLQEEGYC